MAVRRALWMAFLALITTCLGCGEPTALKQECFDIVTAVQVVCPDSLQCAIWSAVQADGTTHCWGEE